MVNNLPESEQASRLAGFSVRLRDPASLTHQRQILPATSSAAGLSVSISDMADAGYSTDTIQYSAMIANTVRFAHKHGIGMDTINRMMVAPKSEVFGMFERLGYEIAAFLAEFGQKAQQSAKEQMLSTLKGMDNPELIADFIGFLDDLSQSQNFNIGMIRDLNSAYFGQESHILKFRMFDDPSLCVCSLGFNESEVEAAACASVLIDRLSPIGLCSSFVWNKNQFFTWWMDDVSFKLPETVVLSQVDRLMELIGDNRDELEGEVDDSDVLSPDFQDSYPELYALLLEAAGSTEDVETMISDAMGISENTGIEFWSAVANVLALAKFGHFDDLLSKSGRDYSYVCKTGKFEVLSSDSTYFSDWLSRSAPYVQETAALSSQGGEVFNSIGESDLHVDLCVAIEPIAISGVEFLTENYEYHHENLMNGEIECVSACINLNDATLAAIEGWQRSIPIIAAIAAVSNARKG